MAYPNRIIHYLALLGFIMIGILNIPQSSMAADEDIIIYGANAYYRADVIEINLTPPYSSQWADDLLFDTQAIALGPDGKVYYFEWADSGNELARWDPLTNTNELIRTYDSTAWSIAKRADFHPDGSLYLMDSDGELYEVDTGSGDLTYIGLVEGIPTASSSSGDIAFSPDGLLLYIVIGENLYSVDMADMSASAFPKDATLLDSNMIPGGGWTVWTGLAFCDGALYASDVNFFNRNSSIYKIELNAGYPVTHLINTGTMLNDLTSCPVGPVVSECTDDGDCDDGLYCNGVETCVDGACQPGTPINCDDGVTCTVDSCNEDTDMCDNVPNNALCDNGQFCDGTEICDSDNGCLGGSDPCLAGQVCDETFDECVADCTADDAVCDDGDTCTTDSCDTATGLCNNEPNYPCCGDTYCDTGEDPCSCSVDCGTPTSTETACSDGIDNDCDGFIDAEDQEDCSSCRPSGSWCYSDAQCCSNDCRGWWIYRYCR